VEADGGLLARRALAFATAPQVWRVRGRMLEPAVAEPLAAVDAATGGPGGELSDLGAIVERLTPTVRAMGADLVAHPDGSLRLEVLGLEVGRVGWPAVDDQTGPALRLEIGVGRHDREAHRMVQGDLDADGLGDLDGPVAAALDEVVTQVNDHRRAGIPSHPANQLAPERWLRTVLVARPDLVGAATLTPVEIPTLPSVLGEVGPAAALGTDSDGRPVLVVCSTGVDPDLVPAAVDACLSLSAGYGAPRASPAAPGKPPRLVLAVPEQDDHPLTRALASALSEPAQVRAVDAAWRAATHE